MNRYRWTPPMHQVYDYLAIIADDDGYVTFTIRGLADRLKSNHSTMHSAVKRLQEAGATVNLDPNCTRRGSTHRMVRGL